MRRVLVIGVCLAALAACGQPEAKRVHAAGAQDGKEPAASASRNAPATLPTYVKLYPGAETRSSEDRGAKGGLVVLQTPDSPDEVIEFYKKQATVSGMQVEIENNSGGSHVVIFQDLNGGKRSFTVSATKQPDGKTNIGLTFDAQA